MSTRANDGVAGNDGVSEFRKRKLERDAQRNWDRFYLRNSTVFFKDRHWARNELVEVMPDLASDEAKVLLECGCGVGNFAFPLLEYFPNLFIYACDFSPRAVQYVQSNKNFTESRITAFTADLTRDALSSFVPVNSVDVCTLVFVLSSIGLEQVDVVARNIWEVLKSTGSVFIRDYARDDYAQKRFGAHQKLAENFYVRQDGTRSYFFTKEGLSKAFVNNGFREASVTYIHKETVNRKDNVSVPRLFIQASCLLDAVDGYAARFFNQSSRFGAMLDMLTDRCTTLCLLCALAVLYPRQLLFFQLFAVLDISSHWLHMHSHDLHGSKSHKTVSPSTSWLLHQYYTSRAFLFFMCLGNEAFFWALYMAHFDAGPIVLGVRCVKVLACLSFPVALVKSGISVIHLVSAAKSIARFDVRHER
uniref:Methyltransf_12 domain-containing protein n=1 Tax=Trichuris muris TaxID=70415 RepID=A0A5S6QPS8_TRIMR